MAFHKKFFSQAAVVFFVALVLRSLLLGLWYHAGQAQHLSGDTISYLKIAESIAAGRGYLMDGVATARRVPVYPVVLALALRLDSYPLGVQIFQVFLGALSALLLYRLSCYYFEPLAGFLAAIFFSCDYLTAKQPVYILTETLSFFLILVVIFCLKSLVESYHFWKVLLAGTLAGLAVLTKESLCLYGLMLPFLMGPVFREKRIFLKAAVIFLMAFLFFTGGWIIRNKIQVDRSIGLTESTGLTFYIGNNPRVKPIIYGGEWRNGIDTEYPVPPAPDDNPRHLSDDAFYFEQAIGFVKNRPREALRNFIVKTIRFWHPFYSDAAYPIKCITFVSYAIILVGSLLGAYQTRKRWREFLWLYGLILYLTGIHVVTIPAIRYRFLFWPFLMMLAGTGFGQIWLHLKSKLTRIDLK